MGTRLNMIGLFVSDLPKMTAFERQKLPTLLGQEPSFPSGLNGTFELAVNVGDRTNVDVEFERMRSLGAAVVYGPRDEPWKMRSAMVADPDGNLIEIAYES